MYTMLFVNATIVFSENLFLVRNVFSYQHFFTDFHKYNGKYISGLTDRLKDGETVVVAEGYLFEFEARGYLKSGGFVPEVVLDHPELVKTMHEEFVHAGSDVVVAFTVSL